MQIFSVTLNKQQERHQSDLQDEDHQQIETCLRANYFCHEYRFTFVTFFRNYHHNQTLSQGPCKVLALPYFTRTADEIKSHQRVDGTNKQKTTQKTHLKTCS